ncbi:hypothetical protein HY440_01335 [Candidatus Microgenomates bacterium]|nr:hypothetical protein [Candidatus Microgenomates bacterium]
MKLFTLLFALMVFFKTASIPVWAAGCEVDFGRPIITPRAQVGQSFDIVFYSAEVGKKYMFGAFPSPGSPGKATYWGPMSFNNSGYTKFQVRIDSPGVYTVNVQEVNSDRSEVPGGVSCSSPLLAVQGQTPTCPPNTSWSGDIGKTCCVDSSGKCASNDQVKCTSDIYDTYRPGFGCYSSKAAGSSWEFANICDNQTVGVQTAIGCIPTDKPEDFLTFIFRFVLGISGAVILIMFIITSYNILTSAGNPEKLQGAKENLISIFSGLILIGFSLLLLQAIGLDILGLPTF